MRVLWLLLSLVVTLPRVDTDWPQWGGRSRDFVVAAAAPAPWPDSGPSVLWRRPIGDGYSSIVAVGGRLFTLERTGDEEAVVALDAATGATIWATKYAAPFEARYVLEQGPGPRATPLVADGVVVATGASGWLHALDAATGRVLWQINLIAEQGGTIKVRGYACSPLLWKHLAIVQVGGDGQALVAFDLRTGKIAWKGGTFKNSYASPILIDVDGQPQIVALTFGEVSGFDPDSGRLLWSHPHPTQDGVAVSTPVWDRDEHLLFVSSSYGGGSRVIEIRAANGTSTVTEKWAHQRVRIHHGNALIVNGAVIAASGDTGVAPLSAVDLKTGEMLWRDRSIDSASLLRIGNRVLALTDEGRLALVEVTRAGVTTLAQTTPLTSTSWTPPSVAGDVIYLRNRKEIVALKLR